MIARQNILGRNKKKCIRLSLSEQLKNTASASNIGHPFVLYRGDGACNISLLHQHHLCSSWPLQPLLFVIQWLKLCLRWAGKQLLFYYWIIEIVNLYCLYSNISYWHDGGFGQIKPCCISHLDKFYYWPPHIRLTIMPWFDLFFGIVSIRY